MTVGELITALNKYDKNQRVLLYAHGRCSIEQQDMNIKLQESKG